MSGELLRNTAAGKQSSVRHSFPGDRQGTVLTLRMLTNDEVDVHLSTGMGGTGANGSLRVRWWWKSLTTVGEEQDHEHFLDSRSRLVRRARGDGVVEPESNAAL